MIEILIYGIILMVMLKFTNKRIIKRYTVIVFFLLIISESFINTAYVINRDVYHSNIDAYIHQDTQMEKITDIYNSKKDDFYRMEMEPQWTFNPGQLYNYKGISYYSSVFNGDTCAFLSENGYRMYGLNVSIIYNPFSPIMNSFLSIKYAVDKQSIYDLAGMEAVDEIYGYRILENKYNLPIAFIVDDAIRDWEPSVYIDPMKVHNSLLNAAVGYEANAYETIPISSELCENAILQHNDNWSYQYYSRIDETNPVKFNFIYEINESGYYFFTHGFKRGNLTVRIDDIVKDYDIADQMTSLGYIEKGTTVNLEIVEEGVATEVWGINFFTLNEDAFTRCYEMLIDNSVEIISASDTKIKCKVDAPNYGILYTSIPDDGGWTVKCNGKKIETFKISDCLLAIDLPEGENIVEFTYHVPGLRIGLFITLLSIVIFIILIIKGKFIIKRMMI